MGGKCGKLPARKPGKITIHQYIVCYTFQCTCPCIICTIHLYIVHYICHCTHLCIAVQPVCRPCITSVIAPVHASSIQPICTLCIITVIATVRVSPIPSIHPSDDECQEFPDEFPSTKYGKKHLSEITVKFPHNVTLTLHQVKFLEETPDTTKRVIYLGNFMST